MAGARLSSAARALTIVAVLSFALFARGAGAQSDAGQAAFDRTCAGCHGVNGGGDVGPRLVPFTRGNRELLGIVRDGTGQMPALSARDVTDDEVIAVAEYLRRLSSEAGRGAPPQAMRRR
jgi:mono/diheme cytochrome c family protein